MADCAFSDAFSDAFATCDEDETPGGPGRGKPHKPKKPKRPRVVEPKPHRSQDDEDLMVWLT